MPLFDNDARWRSRFNALKRFKKKYGHTKISAKSGKDEAARLALYKWVYRQRKRYLENDLSVERRNSFDELGVDWGASTPESGAEVEQSVRPTTTPSPSGVQFSISTSDNAGTTWNMKFKAIKKYMQANGHTNPNDSDKALHRWVSRQQDLYREGKLPKELEERLNSIGFQWAPDERKRAPSESKTTASRKRVIKDYHPKRADIENPGRPIRTMPTYTTVYTADLYEMIGYMANGTMDIPAAIEKLKEMAHM